MSSSAKRALKILATVGESARPMGVTEIARALGMAPGTAFRGLDALQGAGLLARHPSSPRYVLGPAALGLRQTVLSSFRLREVCLPYLRQLASMSGETSSLYVRVGWYAARIATAPGTAEVTSGASQRGAQLLSAHAAGGAILAHLPRDQIARYIAWAASRGIAIPKDLDHELGAIRARGCAIGTSAEASPIAFPIRKSDQSFAAIAIEGPGAAPARAVPPWHQIAGVIEALLRANEALAHQPFEHFEPDDIVLPS